MRSRLRRRRRQHYERRGEGGLELSSLGDVRIGEILGEGVSCTVHRAEWKGRDVALKLYKAGAVERHDRLVGGDLAEYEYERNLAFFRAPGLSVHVAEPLAYLSTGSVCVFVQELLTGQLYYRYYGERNGEAPPALLDHVRHIVELAHAAELYDVDLHAANLMIVEDERGEPIPKLFDFNFIPFYIHPPNPLIWLLLKVGFLDVGSRDRRKLRQLHDFRRIERQLAARV